MSELSHAAARWRAIAAGSVMVRAVDRRGRRGLTERRDDRRREIVAADQRLAAMFDASAVGRSLVRVCEELGVSWRRSYAAGAAQTMRSRVARLSLPQRVRSATLLLLTAVVVHLLMTGFDAPEPTVLARATWTAIAGGLVAVIAAAGHVAAAWVDFSSRGHADREGERE